MSGVLALWAFLRLGIGLVAAFITSLQPGLPLEQTIPLLPASGAGWLERALLSPLLRWDAHWYMRILTQGYAPEDGTTQFHPLYPLLAKALNLIGLHPALSLLLVSSLMGIGFLYLCQRLAAQDLPPEQAKFAALFLLLFPLSLVLFLPYSEASFLFFSALALLAGRDEKWWLAGLASALACLTRQQGILLLFPLLWMLWQSFQAQPERKPRALLGTGGLLVGCVALAELGWMAFRWQLGDFSPDLSSAQAFIYSVFITPQASQVVTLQAFVPPWQLLAQMGSKLRSAPDVDIWVNLVGGLVFLGLALLAWPRLRKEERLYSALILLTSFSYYTGPQHPTMGLLRHCYLAFPLLLAASTRFSRPWQRLLVTALSLLGTSALLLFYVLETWVL